MRYLEAIKETTYLSVQNAPQYRRIMRIFFTENEKMNFQLYKEDVFELIRQYPEFEDYSMEQLKSDLSTLVEWKNLVPIQDPKRVYTIADYKNKQFRYAMSEYSVEIERMTVKLENLFIESSNLSPSYFVRIEEALTRLQAMKKLPLKDVNDWWRNLQEDFKRLNQNYQDYLREFYSGNSDKLLKSMEFILYKDRFITYLKEFIRELQINTTRTERLLEQISPEDEQRVLTLVIQSEMDMPHPNAEAKRMHEEYIRENVHGKWQALKRWFLPVDGRPSESSRVLDITDEVIRKIIQNAALIVQLQNWGISRKDDYRKFIEMFCACQDVAEAHKLAAHIFGVQHIRHYKVNQERSTDSINSSTYEEEAMEYPLKPQTRAYRPRIDKSGFENKAMEKLAQRNLYLDQMAAERKMVMKYIKNGKLDIGAIDEIVPASTRQTLLRWISLAAMTNSGTGRTEYGQSYRLLKQEGLCTLQCEDGELTMPAYVLEFMEDSNGRG